MESCLNKMAFLFFFAFAAVQIQPGESACTFPSSLYSGHNGTWRSTRWDDVIFTSNTLTVPDLDDLGTNVEFDCESQSGTKYLLRSASSILSNSVEIVSCIDLSEGISTPKTMYYHATTEMTLPSGAQQPVRLVGPGSTITTTNTCTKTSYEFATYDFLIPIDSLSSAVITCPDPLLADFGNYTVTTSSVTSCSSAEGYIHVCDHVNTVEVDYSACSTVIFYSSGGSLYCMYYTTSGSTYYINLMNQDSSVDNSATYHFTCLVLDYSSSPMYMSQVPRRCQSSQTATAVPSTGGSTFELYTNQTCIPSVVPTESTSSTSNILFIAAGAGGFVLIALVILFAYFCIHKGHIYNTPCCKKEKKRRSNEKSKKSGKVAPDDGGDATSKTSLDLPMDAKTTGLHATAIIVPADEELYGKHSRPLDTAQSMRSQAVTPSHMQTELLLDEQTPRRLPALEPITPAHGHQLLSPNESGLDPNDSFARKLPPINDPGSLQS